MTRKRSATANAKAEAERLSHQRHHTVVVLRQSVQPTMFSCPACGLTLQGYGSLNAAGWGGSYTRRTRVAPEEYYGLIDPAGDDFSKHVDAYLADMANEYDNE